MSMRVPVRPIAETEANSTILKSFVDLKIARHYKVGVT